MRDHGGNLDEAMARFGGGDADWLDLSTGINRAPYPLPAFSAHAANDLPTKADMARLCAAARMAYATTGSVLPVAGAQAAIQMIPRLCGPGTARVLSPTYNEHAASLRAAGWSVDEVTDIADLAGADLAVAVNPNNPDGRAHDPETLLALSGKVGRLVVDESFCDPVPQLSVAAKSGVNGLLVLRSFGKFYGLAGLRLGFVLGSEADISALSAMSGPWPVSGFAIEAGIAALSDSDWKAATIARLTGDAMRMDGLAAQAGWNFVGGTALFRLYETPDAMAAQERLARGQVWSRIFPYNKCWIRLGLPGTEAEWEQVERALPTVR